MGYKFKDHNKYVFIAVKPYKNGARCPECGRRCEIVASSKERCEWRDIPVHGIEIFLVYHPREIKCPTHGRQ